MLALRHLPKLFMGCLMVSFGTAYAQPNTDQDSTDSDAVSTEDTIVVIGTRIDDNASARGAGWSLISRDEIALLPVTQTLSALQNQAGAQVSSKGSVAGRNFISLRGGDDNFAQVLVEQVKANDISTTSGGSFDFANIDPNFIDRLEVLTRPSSAIYGADAISGVISASLQTYDAATPGELWGEWVSDEERQLGGYYGAPIGDFGLLGGLSHYEDEGNGGEFYDRDSLLISLANHRPDAMPLRLVAHLSETKAAYFPETSGGFEAASLRDLETETADQALVSLQFTPWRTDTFDWEVTASWLNRDAETQSPGIVLFGEQAVPASSGSTEFDRIDASTFIRGAALPLNAKYIFGANWSREDGISNGAFDFGVLVPDRFELERDTIGVFAETELIFSDQLSTTLGIRHDDYESETQTTGKADLVYQFNAGQTDLSAHWSQGFKLPSFFALGSTLVGNPDLVPEESEHISASLAHAITPRLTVRATVFQNVFENLIEFDPDLFTNINLSEVEVEGVELEAELTPSDTLTLTAFGILSDYEVDGEAAELRLRPESQWGLDAFWTLNRGLALSARAAYIGERQDNFLAAGNVELDDYVTVDVNSVWSLSDRARLKLGLLNLFDEDYEETFGNPAKGARVFIALEGDF